MNCTLVTKWLAASMAVASAGWIPMAQAQTNESPTTSGQFHSVKGTVVETLGGVKYGQSFDWGSGEGNEGEAEIKANEGRKYAECLMEDSVDGKAPGNRVTKEDGVLSMRTSSKSDSVVSMAIQTEDLSVLGGGVSNLNDNYSLTASVAATAVPANHSQASPRDTSTTYNVMIADSGTLESNSIPIAPGTYHAGDEVAISSPITLQDGTAVTLVGSIKFCETRPVLDATGTATGTEFIVAHLTGTSSDGVGGDMQYEYLIDQSQLHGITPDQVITSCSFTQNVTN